MGKFISDIENGNLFRFSEMKRVLKQSGKKHIKTVA
jgi:hypothetical protein